jgi:hypothetical protein
MKLWLCLAAVLALLAPETGRAHIGDDLSQLRQVYGATGAKVGGAIIFQRNGYSICVYFDGDKSAMEVFTRDGSQKDKNDLTTKDIGNVLELEGQGQGWGEMASKSGKLTCWVRADQKIIARLSQAADDQTGVVQKILVVMVNQK